ncbi:amino acid ABC transporter permease [Solwaraspora sp. WMMD1047]|uniref:amino acid ABC transporter permease n=1 Tax=Solwaraspora sp. WMMD1047 TaxID=3016102 RepID=UPI0024166E72|nr:amino acid ABC transporter permease [Solwaraspora sp. WMMD1047]MDG4829733.1 amino acid ABC transporter permease [Solwaraspora sp. WMMD1047]
MSGERGASVLYDAPGPRAKRITNIASVITAGVIAVGAYFLVYRPLAEREQFSMELWGPLVDPGNEYFTTVWGRLGDGFLATLKAAALAILASLVLGTALAVLRIQLKAALRRRFVGLATPLAYALRALSWTLNTVTRIFVEVFRGIPVVITIFFVWRGLPSTGVDLGNTMWYLVIGLTLYNMVVIAEILRSGMEGLAGGQREAADAIGLSSFQTTRLVLLPQAFRIMLPALISQLVVILKDTSLGFIIGYQDALRIGRSMAQELTNQIQMYFVIGVIFVLVNYALSKLAQYVERRLARGQRTDKTAPAEPPASTLLPAGGDGAK